MKYRVFPGTSIRVSEIGFGTWTISTGWWGTKSDAEAIAMMRRALDDFGITFFDAADAYGNGRAERQIAEAFRGRRQDVVIGTKVGYDIYDEAAQRARRGQNELPMRTDPTFIRFAVDKCLERLETDYIDVLQLHNAKMEHVRDPELWETMRTLQREGKIRAWGAAFGPAIIWMVLMSRSRSTSSTASYNQPIAGPNAAPHARIFPSRCSARNVSQSSGSRTCSIFALWSCSTSM